MTGGTCSIVVQTTILDTPELQRRLFADELAILRRHADAAVVQVKAGWVGWKYKGRNPASVGRSRAGWARKVQATKYPFLLVIFNEATSFYTGKPYAVHVHRSGSAALEYLKVFAELDKQMVPALVAELTKAIQTNINRVGPMRRLRANRESATVTTTLT